MVPRGIGEQNLLDSENSIARVFVFRKAFATNSCA